MSVYEEYKKQFLEKKVNKCSEQTLVDKDYLKFLEHKQTKGEVGPFLFTNFADKVEYLQGEVQRINQKLDNTSNYQLQKILRDNSTQQEEDKKQSLKLLDIYREHDHKFTKLHLELDKYKDQQRV